MIVRIGLFLLLIAGLGSPLQAQTEMTDKQIIAEYNACLKFLKMTPAQQAVIAQKAHQKLSAALWACRLQKSQGLQKVLELNHEYNTAEEGGESYGPAAPSSPPVSSALTSGTCYSMSGCNGPSVHVDSKIYCPGGYDAFEADMGGLGCESL